MTVLMARLGAGPAFKYYYNKRIETCDQRMWKSILFIQNYDKYTDMVGSYYSNARLNCSNDSLIVSVRRPNMVSIGRSSAVNIGLFRTDSVG